VSVSKEYRCGECGSVLPSGAPTNPLEDLCPYCGAESKSVHIVASDEVALTASASSVLGKGIVLPAIPILLSAVIELGSKSREGQTVLAVAPAWAQIIATLARDPDAMHRIPWRKWEELIAAAYAKDGYDVTLTPRSADHGRDVIAVKTGYCTVRIVDSVKAYKPGHLVTADEVRALWGVVNLDRASKGVVSTTSSFAPRITSDPFLADLMPHRLELIDGQSLLGKLKKVAGLD
jgi:restriction system protein